MKTYNPTLTPGQVYTVAGGNSFHLISAGSGINVQYLKADLTDINETATDVEAGYFVNYPKNGFDLVKITNGLTAQNIKFGVARDGEGGYNIGSSNIVGGVIDLITTVAQVDNDGGFEQNNFTRSGLLPAVAGQYSFFTINNPVANNKDIVLKSLILSSVAGNNYFSGDSIVANTDGASSNAYDKLIGSAFSVSDADCRHGTIATLTSSGGRGYKHALAGVGVQMIDGVDTIIKPNYGMRYVCRAPNQDLTFSCEFEERPTI